MIRLLAAVSAVALYGLTALTSPLVLGAALAGLLPAAAAIVTRWRGMATVAACGFLIVYAAALSIERKTPDVASALALGLGLVIFTDAVDLSARLRGATVEGSVVRRALGRWIGLGLGVGVVAIPLAATSSALAASVPDAAAPLLAAAGALASVLILAALVRRAA
ncbi:MAG TPA: hypothetical protein VID28_05395 [Methylomirabilota bacterium]|jgi:hypothetical protein